MTAIKTKFARQRLERRLQHAEQLAQHPRKGGKWTRIADDLRRRLVRLDQPAPRKTHDAR